MEKLNLAVLAGDGIGKDVMEAVLPVFDKLNININLNFGDIGWEQWKNEGNPIPERTWEIIDKSDAILLGATTSKPKEKAILELNYNLKNHKLNYISPIIQLRQRLKLFANVRPVFSIPNNPCQISDNMNMVIIRENTEGLYAGLDFNPIPEDLKNFINKHKLSQSPWDLNNSEDGAVALRLITSKGIERIIRFAFEWAADNNFSRVTWVDKPNVLRSSGQFAINILNNIAKDYPNIDYEVLNVDATAMWMVRNPEHFGVIVSENQFGDILSDLGAGLMGGLGLAPSANLGYSKSYFEPVHGSAPKHAGKDIVNPSAMFLTTALMLKQNGYEEEGKIIEKSVKDVITEGKFLTYDLNGTYSTTSVAKEIIRRCC